VNADSSQGDAVGAAHAATATDVVPDEVRDRLARLSPAKRAIIERRREAAAGGSGRHITARAPDSPLVLSWAQERLWLLDQLETSSAAYNAPRAVRLRGPLDADALQAALEGIIARHEVLRTTIGSVDGEPVVHVLDQADGALRRVDVTGFAGDIEAEARRLLRDEVRRPFDLSRDLMLRGLLVRLAPDDHMLAIVSHHIASDEPSKRLVAAELEELYASHRSGRATKLEPLALQYGDYVAWQRNGSADLDREVDYWRNRLRGAPAALELPTDRPRPPFESHRGAKLRTVLPAACSEGLRALGREQQATLFMTLTAGFAAVLEHWCGQPDLVIGTPITGRTHVELEPLIGFFSNTLALRVDVSGDPTFPDLVARVRETCLGAYAHQKLPFERLVEELRPQRDLSRNPIFQVMFTLRPGGVSPLRLEGVESEPVAFETGWSKFDLNVIAIDDPAGIAIVWEYSTDLFDRRTIERLGARFERLVTEAVAQPHRPLSQYDLLAPDELEELAGWNATAAPSRVECLHTLIGEQAAAGPDVVAVRGPTGQLTYAELWQAGLRLAGLLRTQGVGPGSLVGLWGERRPELLVGIVGILAAGGAYVPLEPSYPLDRLEITVRDAGLDLVVVPGGDVPGATALGVPLLALDDPRLADEPLDSGVPCPDVTPDDLAYVIFTSGSTGRPKGVMIEHRGVVNLLEAMAVAPGLSAGEVMVGLTTPAFDLSVPDLFLPLVTGATLVLAPPSTTADPDALATLLDREQADLAQATPATWSMLCESGWTGRPGLRVVCGGERYSAGLVRALAARGVSVWNFYGPTEATVWGVSTRLEPTEPDPVPMGWPIKNVRCDVVDGHGRLVALGSTGELHLSGAGVARGYLNRPDLTADRFVTTAQASEGRSYRTGDLVRRRADGALVFVGRADDQVKLRGYRIELGEIETVLAGHPAVTLAAATLREDVAGDPRLLAYVVVAPDSPAPPAEELRALVARKLPAYMVPSKIFTIDVMPRTSNGKLDRALLPTDAGEVDTNRSTVAPRTPEEEVLAGIWTELLGLEQVGVTDNFFDLGGHSLLAARMVARVEAAFTRKVPLAIVMQAGTIEQIVRLLDDRGREFFRSVLLIKDGDSPIPLFCVHGMAGTVTGYRHLLPHLDREQRVYGIQAPGLDGEQLPLRRVQDLAEYYVSEIKAIQPSGPYLLTGVCFGSLVVFEMAHQLTTQHGDDVALVGLIDPPVIRSTIQQIRRRIAKLQLVDSHNRRAFLRETFSIFVSLANRKAWGIIVHQYGKRQKPLPRRPHAIEAVNRMATLQYKPPIYKGPTVLIRSGGLRAVEGEGHALAWSTLTGENVDVMDVLGVGHLTLFREPYVQQVGRYLQDSIDRVLSGYQSHDLESVRCNDSLAASVGY
jgi:amino acid adenylation domain-containing protein